MGMNRINPEMTIEEAIDSLIGESQYCVSLGALLRLELMWTCDKIDPDALGGIRKFIGPSYLRRLDSLGIYEDRIYLLWNDVCGRSLAKMMAVLRAYQLGNVNVDEETLNHAIDNRGAGLNLDEIIKAVKEELPNFNPEFALKELP